MAATLAKEIVSKTYGPATGPFGFPMRDDVATEIDRIIKSLPKECREAGFQRVTTCQKAGDNNDDERSDVSFITTDSLDRDSEVLAPDGLDWSQFKKNPVVPFGHEYRALPVGRAAWWKKQSQDVKGRTVKGWIGKTIYCTQPPTWKGDWFADAVWHMVQQDMLPGKSIGFLPLEMRGPTDKETKDETSPYGQARRIWSKALVLEWSIAPVQSNPDAIVQEVAKLVKKGVKLPDSFLEEFELQVPDAIEDIDWAALQERELARDKSIVQPVSTVIAAQTSFVTLGEMRKSLEEQVMMRLAGITPESLIKEAVARRHGSV